MHGNQLQKYMILSGYRQNYSKIYRIFDVSLNFSQKSLVVSEKRITFAPANKQNLLQ